MDKLCYTTAGPSICGGVLVKGSMFPMIQAGILDGKRICSIQYKHANFHNTLSPDPASKECPKGHYKCNNESVDMKYQLCIPNDPALEEGEISTKMETRCPINKISFMKSDA